MKDMPQDLRTQTLNLVTNQPAAGATDNVRALISAWLGSLDEEDLAGTAPQALAPVLWDGFMQAARRAGQGCQIAQLRYSDGKGGMATALLILNEDMPYLVDSFVMALRKERMLAAGVMNAVLPVERDANGVVTNVGAAGAPLESFVLVLLNDELEFAELDRLTARIRMVASDAATVHRDALAMGDRMTAVAAAAAAHGTPAGQEVAAFLEWAKNEGFEPFGYAYYEVQPGQSQLVRDIPSRIGVLKDTAHPVYGTCLANIPGELATLSARAETLSIVKADVEGTLHRDQPLDFIGVRNTDAQGNILGEHCFVGLFTRAATSTPLARLPFARGRVAKVLSLAGVRQEGFRAEKFLEILESLPRTEALEADPEWLAQVCSSVVSLYKQPRPKVFARRDVYGRHLNALVYLPRERYSAAVAASLAQALKDSSGAHDVRVQTLVADGPLARVYLIAHAARNPLDLETDIQQPLLAVLDGWHDRFAAMTNGVEEHAQRSSLRKMGTNLPVSFVTATAPDVAFRDLQAMLGLGHQDRVAVRIEPGSGAGNEAHDASIRLYSGENVPSLSRILPALQNAGIAVDREQTWAITTADGVRHHVTALAVDDESGDKLVKAGIAPVAEELFTALFNNEAEDGRLNGLTIEGGLSVREVQLVRGYISYWRQLGSKFSVRYMAETLRAQPALVKEFVTAFLQRFNPALSQSEREQGTAKLASLRAGLSSVNHADTEEIMTALVELALATVRTNYFQNTGEKIIFKFDTSNLSLAPEPRPYREIYVFSRRFEGVHLRGGPVARGGLRWSDRMEDYRTEVLGLVKAQMVKNAVIVPAGSKGGFVCKQMPKDAVRETVAAEGESVYRLFISSLLEVTDNRVRGAIVAPENTVRYDQDDPYLVVAADKGTATFSDIANGIAVQRGFWLGDAFASGGSNGYDHKKMGITAKGAFEAVKRHFYEIGHDMSTTPITMVGVGDMSGDVFGNGVLLSRQLKVLAAFDHRHIFLDPTPDVAVSFAERQRMFALPRSSWEDYDKSLISQGGGVYPRSARSIDLSPEVRAALDIQETSLAPEELMHRILLAPVDLFYNGGIGTYIKASTETHAQVKDRANDRIRVSGNELRCKVVAEGGNLGATQAGRIEFALAGGRIFTDAIDNSAGVDCSDHEVNIKIWLDTEVNAGKLPEADRNRVLNDMTNDVEVLVLRDNTQQTRLLTREVQAQQNGSVVDSYAALITSLEAEGAVSRELEQLPLDAELQRRKALGVGLTAPELAVVVANVKNRFKRILAALPLTDEPWADTVLRPYFPAQLVATRDPLDHPLANAILATVLANEAVNRCGPLMIRDLAAEHRIDEAEVVKAWGRAWSALNLAPVFDALDADALKVPREVSIAVDARTRALLRALIEGVLSLPQGQDGMAELTALFANGDQLRQLMPAKSEADGHAGLNAGFVQAWKAVETIESLATFLFAAVSVQRPAGMSLAQFLQVGMALRAKAGIDTLERGLKLPPQTKSQEQLRNYAMQALRRTQQRLLLQVIDRAGNGDALAAVDAVTGDMGLTGYAQPTDLEQAMLDVWSLSEGSNPERLAA
ncbi:MULTISPECIES: NAD-glutamate dehydrogenase domain-containing protein [unclassified Massilia]|uniref:NAD-glutamate dehydrogenase domain-containing protein n=1 Tax=unclassified Massilia TaxID=2609279 RepID=UPI001785572C|nr:MULTISPECIES: NAD-glutamate dehydrogenase domain-containing protein [unclassified Massilia]MBD8530949.1 NAD-glutamate dehydrogenase [Massilia sp. CFBP 13647]MBD8674638.1 NAD-glutamate dehydrogenase [Massilia sp. CFBP 13721]